MNGKAIPVDSSGCFRYAALLSPDRNAVLVTARNSQGEQISRRTFHVVH